MFKIHATLTFNISSNLILYINHQLLSVLTDYIDITINDYIFDFIARFCFKQNKNIFILRV